MEKEQYNIAQKINEGSIENLADIDWDEETDGFDENIIKSIVNSVEDERLKPLIIDIIVEQYKINCLGNKRGKVNLKFIHYCEALKRYAKDYNLFNIKAIREKQNQELIQIRQDIEELKKNVFTIPEELDTEEARQLFNQIKWCAQEGGSYRWNGTCALFGAFVDLTSDKLNIRPSNGRIPWKIYRKAFQCSEGYIKTAQQAVNDYKNNGESEPEGYQEIKSACK